MFDKEELFILKELVELEIEEVKNLIEISDSSDKEELKAHKIKLETILNKIKSSQ